MNVRITLPLLFVSFFIVTPVMADLERLGSDEVKIPGRVFLYHGEIRQDAPVPVQELAGRPFHMPPSGECRFPSGVPSLRQEIGSDRIKVVSRAFEHGGMASDTLANGDYCYVGTTGSLSVFDVSNPSAPVLVREIPETVAVLNKSGSVMATVIGCNGDIAFFDISSPDTPQEISRILPPEDFDFRNVSIDGSLALGTGWGYMETLGWCAFMQVIDLSDLHAPSVTGTVIGMLDYYRDVLIHGTTAYLTVADEGLAIFDVSDPVFIKQIGFLQVYPYVDGMIYDDGYLYLSGNGVEIVDVSDPSDPQLLSQAGGAYTADVKLAGNIAYVTDDDDRSLRVYDVTDPYMPEKIGELEAYGRVYYFDLQGDRIYLPDQVYGLVVVDVSEPSEPELMSMTSTGTFPRAVDVEDGMAVVTANFAWLHTLDVSDPYAPEVMGTSEPVPDTTPGNTLWLLGVDQLGGTAVVDHWNWGMHTYDVSDPSIPEHIGELQIGNHLNPVFHLGDLAYTGSNELAVIDLSDPSNPVQIGSGPSVTGSITDIKVYGTTGYMSGYEEVVIFDATNPYAPEEIHRFAKDWVRGVAVDGQILGVLWDQSYYTTYYQTALDLYDVSDPENPTWISSVSDSIPWLFSRPGGSAFTAEDGKFYIAYIEYLSVVDARDPYNPYVAAHYPESPCNVAAWMGHEGVCVSNGLVYLAGHEGLEILRFLDVGLFMTPQSDPVEVQAGDSFEYEVLLKNFTSIEQKVFVHVESGPSEGGPPKHPVIMILKPQRQTVIKMKYKVPAGTAPGSYYLYAHACSHPDGQELDEDRIFYEVLSSGD